MCPQNRHHIVRKVHSSRLGWLLVCLTDHGHQKPQTDEQ
jgi:hypothetical protein